MRIKQGLEGYFRDIRENAKFLDGKQDCKATLEAGFAKILAQGAGCFCLYAVNSGNHTFELQMRINRVRVEFCHLSNQTIKCALFVRLFFVYGNKKRIREGDMEKHSGMLDFL